MGNSPYTNQSQFDNQIKNSVAIKQIRVTGLTANYEKHNLITLQLTIYQLCSTKRTQFRVFNDKNTNITSDKEVRINGRLELKKI